MNDDGQGVQPQRADTQEDIRPPDDAMQSAAGGWRMPEPKFQQSSGYLPQGYIDEIAAEAASLQRAAPEAAAEVATPPAVTGPAEVEELDVGPQPDLLDHSEEPQSKAAAAPVGPQRSSAARMFLVLLGVVGMIAFIAIFLAVVYYLFIASPGGNSPF